MDKKKQTDKTEEKGTLSPDPETLHTTDPQEHMKGPVSSLIQDIKEEAEDDDKEAPKKDRT